MAEEIAAWPVEGAAAPQIAAPFATEAVAPQETAEAVAPADRELGSTPLGRLRLHHDRRSARDVLVEERATPAEGAALDGLRRIAAAGGPQVQRILRLSDDRRAIWYEVIDGAPLTIDALGAEERAALSEPLTRLPADHPRLAVRTPGGPVLLVCPRPLRSP
jgi:hypothetical protein